MKQYTLLIAQYPVTFYHEQYKMHKTYPAGTEFTVIRYDKPFLYTSARVVAPGGLIGTVCLKSYNGLRPETKKFTTKTVYQ